MPDVVDGSAAGVDGAAERVGADGGEAVVIAEDAMLGGAEDRAEAAG
ncbi:hypothetical protein ACTFTM_21095 [Micromonospora sp. RB23]